MCKESLGCRAGAGALSAGSLDPTNCRIPGRTLGPCPVSRVTWRQGAEAGWECEQGTTGLFPVPLLLAASSIETPGSSDAEAVPLTPHAPFLLPRACPIVSLQEENPTCHVVASEPRTQLPRQAPGPASPAAESGLPQRPGRPLLQGPGPGQDESKASEIGTCCPNRHCATQTRHAHAWSTGSA